MFMGSKTDARPAANRAKRIVAIILTVLTIIFMFWPAALYLTGNSGEREGVSFFGMPLTFGGENGILDFTAFSICLYLCLALAIVSLILISLRKTGVVTIIYAIFTVLILLGCIVLMIRTTDADGTNTAKPGAAIFLIPLCAVTAAMLYPASRGKAKAVPAPSVPKSAPPAPVAARPDPMPNHTPTPSRQTPKTASPKTGMLISTFKGKPSSVAIPPVRQYVSAEPELPTVKEPWECPLCGRQNKASDLYCPNCNTIRE